MCIVIVDHWYQRMALGNSVSTYEVIAFLHYTIELCYTKMVSSATLQQQYWKLSCHDAIFVVTDGIAGCHNNNLWCHQWWQSWHHENSQFSVKGTSNVRLTNRSDIYPKRMRCVVPGLHISEKIYTLIMRFDCTIICYLSHHRHALKSFKKSHRWQHKLALGIIGSCFTLCKMHCWNTEQVIESMQNVLKGRPHIR